MKKLNDFLRIATDNQFAAVLVFLIFLGVSIFIGFVSVIVYLLTLK